ncbi:hypothetical protein [Stenotrophomonas sp. SMYL11]|uniref:hypothetical protein n=1 Tax=Stenotrophomonas sp. SMYL11 TaxID=3076042 RepID=UPI002E79BC60|nr:hypothetical protein [Stenotrophomonas sp. SMYL11]
MSKWDGVIICSPLSSTCVVDWAAVTTGLAVLVALGVGVTPVLRDRWHRQRQAKMVARIAVGEVALMEHRLRVAGGSIAMYGGNVNHWTHQEIGKLIAQVSADGVTTLIPHVHSLPRYLEQRLAKCIGLLKAFERSLTKGEKTRPYETVRMHVEHNYYIGLADSLKELRQDLCKWSKEDFEDLTSAIETGVTDANLRAVDEMARYQSANPPSWNQRADPTEVDPKSVTSHQPPLRSRWICRAWSKVSGLF